MRASSPVRVRDAGARRCSPGSCARRRARLRTRSRAARAALSTARRPRREPQPVADRTAWLVRSWRERRQGATIDVPAGDLPRAVRHRPHRAPARRPAPRISSATADAHRRRSRGRRRRSTASRSAAPAWISGRTTRPFTSPARARSSSTTASTMSCTASTSGRPTARASRATPSSARHGRWSRSIRSRRRRKPAGGELCEVTLEPEPPGQRRPYLELVRARRGGNTIRDTRDGIYFSFVDRTDVRDNDIAGRALRPALHVLGRQPLRGQRLPRQRRRRGAHVLEGHRAAPQPVPRQPEPPLLRRAAADGRRHARSRTTGSSATPWACSSRAATATGCWTTRSIATTSASTSRTAPTATSSPATASPATCIPSRPPAAT